MKKIISDTIKTLSIGGTILYPTDTIWGIGCDATNEKSVSNIFTIKQRNESKSMLILVSCVDMLKNYVESIPEIAHHLIETTTSPLTIIYPKAKNIAKNLIAPDGTIGIRIPKNEFLIKLIDSYQKPIVSTSANIASHNSPIGYFDISNEIKMAVDYIVPIELETLSPSKGSEIVKVSENGEFIRIR